MNPIFSLLIIIGVTLLSFSSVTWILYGDPSIGFGWGLIFSVVEVVTDCVIILFSGTCINMD